MKDAILRKARESAEVKEAFFRAEADRIEALARGGSPPGRDVKASRDQN